MKSGYLRILERWSRYGGRTAERDAGSEAERFCGTRRYERSWARQDARASSYEKTLHLDAACRGLTEALSGTRVSPSTVSDLTENRRD